MLLAFAVILPTCAGCDRLSRLSKLTSLDSVIGDDESVSETLAYNITIAGSQDEDLRRLLQSIVDAQEAGRGPPSTFSQLSRRMKDNRGQFLRGLRSNGYYAAEIELALDRNTDPVEVTF